MFTIVRRIRSGWRHDYIKNIKIFKCHHAIRVPRSRLTTYLLKSATTWAIPIYCYCHWFRNTKLSETRPGPSKLGTKLFCYISILLCCLMFFETILLAWWDEQNVYSVLNNLLFIGLSHKLDKINIRYYKEHILLNRSSHLFVMPL